jgi:hypothetical protein
MQVRMSLFRREVLVAEYLEWNNTGRRCTIHTRQDGQTPMYYALHKLSERRVRTHKSNLTTREMQVDIMRTESLSALRKFSQTDT